MQSKRKTLRLYSCTKVPIVKDMIKTDNIPILFLIFEI
jgi:hypothetical protein